MMIDDPIVRELHEADPARGRADERCDTSDADRVVLSRALDGGDAGGWSEPDPTGDSHRPRQVLGLAVVLAVVVVVVAVITVHHGRATAPPASSAGTGHTVTLVYQAQRSPASPTVTAQALKETVGALRARVDQLGVARARIRTYGHDLISVSLPGVHDIARVRAQLGTTAQLSFYDWEANVLLANGQTVASGLAAHNPRAEQISRGGRGGPGGLGSGGVSLYRAVTLASRQSAITDASVCTGTRSSGGCVMPSRLGAQYYLFAASGSQACATAAADRRTVPVHGEHCLLGGPDSSIANLRHDLVGGVAYGQGRLESVPQGTVVLQASDPSSFQPLAFSDPAAQYFVIRDRVALTGAEITHPEPGRTPGGSPDVTFRFTPNGARAFQDMTAAVAHREIDLGDLGPSGAQHFVIALDGTIVSTTYIDARRDPDGVVAAGGSSRGEITGGFSAQAAEQLAGELRLGVLPLDLTLVGERP